MAIVIEARFHGVPWSELEGRSGGIYFFSPPPRDRRVLQIPQFAPARRFPCSTVTLILGIADLPSGLARIT